MGKGDVTFPGRLVFKREACGLLDIGSLGVMEACIPDTLADVAFADADLAETRRLIEKKEVLKNFGNSHEHLEEFIRGEEGDLTEETSDESDERLTQEERPDESDEREKRKQ